MESRQPLGNRIHFFEYYSLEKFEESLRNALHYSVDVITQSDTLVQYNQYSKEIVMGIEFLINIPYAIKYNASYCEYFYGFTLNRQAGIINRVVNLTIRLILPYLQQKIADYNRTSLNNNKYIKSILQLIKLIDVYLKLRYLLDKDSNKYSLFYCIIKQCLQRQSIESPYKHLMLILYLLLKLLDYYFQKKNAQPKQSSQQIQPIKHINPEQVQQYCPKCMRIPQIPAVLKSTGYVYCLQCLQQMVIQKDRINNQLISDEHIIKIYQ